MSQSNSPPRLASGPDEPFDVNVDDASFEKLALWRERFGDVVCVKQRQRQSPALVLNNPEHVRHVLIGNNRNYVKGVGFERVKMLLGNGIIVSDGDFWRSQRRMIQPVFHRKIIASQAAMMQSCNESKLREWQADAASGTRINITEEMSSLALEVILRSLFSHDLDELIAREGVNPFSLLVEDVTRDLKLAMRFRALTRYLLSQDAKVEQQLHNEVDALAGAPEFSTLAELTYTRQVIDETLRLYPPVWLFSRKAIADDVLPHEAGAVHVPAGADIFLCPWLLHRDERYRQNPESYLPERFSEQNSKARHRHAYYPFSLGSRRCIGEFFSMVDMQLHLGLLAQHIRLKHVPGEPVTVEPHINLRSRHSIMMMPEARK